MNPHPSSPAARYRATINTPATAIDRDWMLQRMDTTTLLGVRTEARIAASSSSAATAWDAGVTRELHRRATGGMMCSRAHVAPRAPESPFDVDERDRTPDVFAPAGGSLDASHCKHAPV